VAFLGGKDEWVSHSKANDVGSDWQRILKFVSSLGWECNPGTVDNVTWGQGTRKALTGFRKAYREEFGWIDDAASTPQTADWNAFFDVLDRRFGELLGSDTAAARAAVTLMDPAVLVCGEGHRPTDVDTHQYLSLRSERLELLLFNDADMPPQVATPFAAYTNDYHAEHVGTAAHQLAAKVVDGADQPIEGVTYEVLLGNDAVRTGTLAADGLLTHDLPAGTYPVRVLQNESDVPPPPPPEPGPEEWEKGNGTLEELLAGDYARRGSYAADNAGFKSADLQSFLELACQEVGCSPSELNASSGIQGSGGGDDEHTVEKGLPVWLGVLHLAAVTSGSWGTNEQIYSRLMQAFYYSYFVETFYAPAGAVMPSNVEYFLQQLGKSAVPGNGAATREAIGGFTYGEKSFSYCMHASSTAFLNGVELFGYTSSALGYSPGDPVAKTGHANPVGSIQGRKGGTENLPRPGDVLTIRGHETPKDGHVVTVIWAEGDGTKEGTVWNVSGNSNHKSVAVKRSTYRDLSGQPPPGICHIVCLSRSSDSQPERFANMTDDQLAAAKITRMPGTFPGPNKAGTLAEQEPRSEVAATRGVLVSGEVPTYALSAPQNPVILRAELKVLSFGASACGGEGGPQDRIVVGPGQEVRLEWLVQCADRIVLQPGDVDLTQATLQGSPSFTLSPADQPPDETGTYRLEASKGEETVCAEVKVVGIFDFAVTGKQRGPKVPEVLQRCMTEGHPRYGCDSYSPVPSVQGLTGSFQSMQPTSLKTETEDFKFWWWGQITPKSDATLSWKAVWDADVELRLTVGRDVYTPCESVDVTGNTTRKNGLLQGSRDYSNDQAQRVFFEADLELLVGGQAVAASLIRLRENYLMPKLESFHLMVGDKTIREGDLATKLAKGDKPVVHWTLSGSHSKGGLELKIVNKDTAKPFVLPWEIRPWVRDGQQTPGSHKQDTGSREVANGLPKGPANCVATLELNTRYGVVASKSVEFVVPGPKGEFPVSAIDDDLDICLFGAARKAMPGVDYEVRSLEGELIQGGKAGADGRFLVTKDKVPKGTREVLILWDREGSEFRFSRDHQVVLEGSDEEQAQLRLHNLGYSKNRALADNLRLFQHYHGLAETGQVDAETLAALTKRHDESQEPGPLPAMTSPKGMYIP
jgi:hypothetical protein